jgi:Zn-dependent M28 family amino/carboxypeptidase
LKGAPRKHTLVFAAFADEERGLLGSRAFVKQLGQSKSLITAMVNLDTLGLSDTKVWASHSDKDLVGWLFGVAKALQLPVAVVNVDNVGDTDSESFRAQKIPTITIHSITQETFKILHSPADRIEAVRFDEYYRTYQLILSYIALLDAKLD